MSQGVVVFDMMDEECIEMAVVRCNYKVLKPKMGPLLRPRGPY